MTNDSSKGIAGIRSWICFWKSQLVPVVSRTDAVMIAIVRFENRKNRDPMNNRIAAEKITTRITSRKKLELLTICRLKSKELRWQHS